MDRRSYAGERDRDAEPIYAGEQATDRRGLIGRLIDRNMAAASQRAAERDMEPTEYASAQATDRRVGPLEQLCEQIANLRARVLSATDNLAEHTTQVIGDFGTGLGTPVEDLGAKISAANNIRSPALLDRLFAEVGSLESSICYLEAQAERASGLA